MFELLGTIPSGFPPFKPPVFTFQNGDKTYTFVEICRNLGSALYITPLVAILESIAIAKSFGMQSAAFIGLKIVYVIRIFCGILKTCIIAKGKKIDASQEMIAIGASNIMGSFASSFPITGSFSRTSVNAASGVRTPFNGIYTGIFYSNVK